MARTIMNLPPLKPGYWWWNTATLGEEPNWEQQPMPADVKADVVPTLFGYEIKKFLKRQYK